MPQISICLPGIGHPEDFRLTLQSLVQQTFTDWELVLVGASEEVQAMAIRLDPSLASRLRCIAASSGDNSGNNSEFRAQQLQQAANASESALLCWLVAGQFCHPLLLQSLHAGLQSQPQLALAASPYLAIDLQAREVVEQRQPSLHVRDLLSNAPDLGVVMLRRSLLDAVGGVNEELGIRGFWDWWLRMLEEHPALLLQEALCSQSQARFHFGPADHRVFQQMLSRHDGQLQLEKIYPVLAQQPANTQLRGAALLDLGSHLLLSSFCPTEAAVEPLTQAMQSCQQSDVAANNLVLALQSCDLQPALVPGLTDASTQYLKNILNSVSQYQVPTTPDNLGDGSVLSWSVQQVSELAAAWQNMNWNPLPRSSRPRLLLVHAGDAQVATWQDAGVELQVQLQPDLVARDLQAADWIVFHSWEVLQGCSHLTHVLQQLRGRILLWGGELGTQAGSSMPGAAETWFQLRQVVQPQDLQHGLLPMLTSFEQTDASLQQRDADQAISEAEELMAAGQQLACRQQLLALLNVYPQKARLFNDLGVLAYQENNLRGAMDGFRRAMRLDPLDASTLQNCAQVMVQADMRDEALRLLEHSVQNWLRSGAPAPTEILQLLTELQAEPATV